MKRVLLVAAIFSLLASPALRAADKPDKPQGRVLNNLVIELLNAREQGLIGKQTLDFINPRPGWCFFTLSGEARVRLDSEKQPLAAGSAAGKPIEAMRHLSAGRHTLHIEGRPSELIVRAIPALQYAFYQSGDTWNLSEGPKDEWQFLKEHVLPNVNVIISTGTANPPGFKESQKEGIRWIGDAQGKAWYAREDHLREWKRQGRSWITLALVPGGGREDVTAEEAYEFWASSVGLNQPLMDGIIVDEFGGGDQPKYDAYRKAVERIYANPKFKGKTYSPYTYGGGILSNDLSRKFARASGVGGGYISIERHLVEKPTQKAALADIQEQFFSGWNMPRFEKDLPGVVQRTVMVLGHMSAVGESLNINPGVDFKVHMDLQMRALATERAYAGLGGIQHYHSGYADDETIRWGSALFRHYAIEGRRNLLSEQIGFKYQLNHLSNPDFADGTNAWKIRPAEQDSIAPAHYEKYGYLQFRYWPDGTGDRFLRMKRNAAKPNAFSQEIRNLAPGKLYSVKMVTGDYQDLVQGRQDKKLHAVSIDLANAEILAGEKNAYQRIFPNHHARPVGAFKAGHSYYMNYHWRVFRAKGATAHLTVSDWSSAKEAGGPTGQELIFNFFEVQPYFESRGPGSR